MRAVFWKQIILLIENTKPVVVVNDGELKERSRVKIRIHGGLFASRHPGVCTIYNPKRKVETWLPKTTYSCY